MDRLADSLAPKQVKSIFIYTHEAHPGEYYPHHTSLEQKTRNAGVFREQFKVARPILVDSLDGECHRAFGSMPNMCWILDGRGRPVYKADWTYAPSVEKAMNDLLNLTATRRETGLPAAPFRTERLEYRVQDREAFIRGLERAGPKAVSEFTAWKQRQQAALQSK